MGKPKNPKSSIVENKRLEARTLMAREGVSIELAEDSIIQLEPFFGQIMREAVKDGLVSALVESSAVRDEAAKLLEALLKEKEEYQEQLEKILSAVEAIERKDGHNLLKIKQKIIELREPPSDNVFRADYDIDRYRLPLDSIQIPPGAIVAFDGQNIPEGWAPVEGAPGRFIKKLA